MYLKCVKEVTNSYGKDALPLPKGTIIRTEFGHSGGVYGKYDLNGEIMGCQVSSENFGRLEFIPKPLT